MSATAVMNPTAAWPTPLSQTRTVAKLHSVTKRYGPTVASTISPWNCAPGKLSPCWARTEQGRPPPSGFCLA